MIIYKDLFTGDELFSDTYPMKVVDGVIYRVTGKMTSEKNDIDESKLGANASAEGGDEGSAESNAVHGVDVVLANRLMEYKLGKKDYMAHIKGYMKEVKEKLGETKPDEVDKFQAGCSKFVKGVVGEFKEYQFYCGESNNPDGMLALMRWEDVDGKEEPFMYFFIHGLEAEKV